MTWPQATQILTDLSYHAGPMSLLPARRYIRKEATMTDNTLTTCLWFNTEAEEAQPVPGRPGGRLRLAEG
jgi:hypothetical protein